MISNYLCLSVYSLKGSKMIKIVSKLKYYKEFYNSDDLVLVFQMGKVGSSTIIKSLDNVNVNNVQVHSFFADANDNRYKNYKFYKDAVHMNFFQKLRGFFGNKYVARLVRKRFKNKKTKIISLVRDPVSRDIAHYFQHIQFSIYEMYRENLENKIYINSEYFGLDYFIKDYFNKFNHEFSINWFDDEFKKFTELDIYKYKFDKKKGYQIISAGNIDLLLIKLEKLNEMSDVIANFIGVDKFEIINENISTDKWYNSVYKDFKNAIEFDNDYINKMYDSKLAKHFYSDVEIENFKNKLNII